jgi:hypothetical protein
MKFALLVSLVLVVACSTGDGEAVPGDGTFAVTTQTPTLVEGSYTDSQTTVSFRAMEIAPRTVEVTVLIDDTDITTHVDHATGEVVLHGRNAQLTALQVRAMAPLAQALEAKLPPEDARTLVEDALLRNVTFIGVAPVGTTLGEIKSVSENGWTYLPCSRRMSYIAPNAWRWTGNGGSCEGRCGIGCGPDNRAGGWGSGKYTYDCARHDYGLGTWTAAFDDYTFAGYNCVW